MTLSEDTFIIFGTGDTLYSELYISGVKLKQDIQAEDSYVFSLPCVKNLKQLDIDKKVTFFVGENGSGKSTLLEAIAVNMGFNAEGGTKNFNFSTADTHSPLYRYMTVIKGVKRHKDGFFLRAESFYNVASEIDRLDSEPSFGPPVKMSYGGKSLHSQSHGESFMSLVMSKFTGNSLYILDEPEAALSPTRQLSLLIRINELVKKGSQFIIATHSPILLAFPDACIYLIGEGGIRPIRYEETEHYTVTRQFLNNPQKMLRYLFEE